uniref:Putative neurotoxin LTDF 16-01 n=1 Tax=Dolomedes fimbriatus TaxID=1432569 RepID=A0A0K1D8G3_9ARAC|nr:putative neurotoxin LTDF 16-01 [Dolomedes fimbriatus]
MNYFKVTCLIFVVLVFTAKSSTGEFENEFEEELETKEIEAELNDDLEEEIARSQALIDEEEARFFNGLMLKKTMEKLKKQEAAKRKG